MGRGAPERYGVSAAPSIIPQPPPSRNGDAAEHDQDARRCEHGHEVALKLTHHGLLLVCRRCGKRVTAERDLALHGWTQCGQALERGTQS